MTRRTLRPDVQGFEAANDVTGFPLWFGNELQSGQTPQDCLEQNLGFHPGQRGAEAKMNARSKGQVRVWRAPDVEFVRFMKHGRIAVGGSEKQPELGAFGHANAANIDFFEHPTLEKLQWSIEAKQFVDGGRNERGIFFESDEFVRIPEQRPKPIGHGIDARFMPGIEQQNACTDQFIFGQRIPGFDDLGKVADQIIVRTNASLTRELAQVIPEFNARSNRASCGFVGRVEFIHAADIGGPRSQAMPIGVGNPQQFGNDGYGQGFGDRSDKVEFSTFRSHIDEFVHDVVDTRAEFFDRSRRERFRNEMP